MRRFGRVLCCLAFSGLVGGLVAPQAAARLVSRIYFDPPQDRNTWHRGDVMRARIEPAAAIPGGLDNPLLELVIGANTREVPGRLYQNGSRGQFYYSVTSEDAAAPDEVRMAKVTLAGHELDLSSFTPDTWAVDGGSDGVTPIIDGIGLSSFFVPSTNEYRPGEDIYWFARRHTDGDVLGAGRPVPGSRPAGFAPAGRRRALGLPVRPPSDADGAIACRSAAPADRIAGYGQSPNAEPLVSQVSAGEGP